jgi:DNA-binding transcriptional regulator YiaG
VTLTDHRTAPAAKGEDWTDLAACHGHARLMEARTRDDEDLALGLCQWCPVQRECLEWVMGLPTRSDPEMVAGGTTYRRRVRMRQRGAGLAAHARHRAQLARERIAELAPTVRALRIARRAAGLTQDDVGRMIGVSGRAVSQWETGTAAPDPDRLAMWATALETDLDRPGEAS